MKSCFVEKQFHICSSSLHDSTIPGKEIVKVSIVRAIISTTEGLNHPLVHHNKRKEKERRVTRVPPLSFGCGTPRYRESTIANINKYSGSLTIECRAAVVRVREPRYRWRSCERKAKAWSGETKSRVTTQSPRDAIRADGASVYRGRAAERRGIPRVRASGQSAYPSTYVCLPYRVPLFRRAFRAPATAIHGRA